MLLSHVYQPETEKENIIYTTVDKMKYFNFTCSVLWVWNLVSHIKGNTQTEGVREHGAEENI
jgi:hypothetical protein